VQNHLMPLFHEGPRRPEAEAVGAAGDENSSHDAFLSFGARLFAAHMLYPGFL
jgi:hypothetical protein